MPDHSPDPDVSVAEAKCSRCTQPIPHTDDDYGYEDSEYDHLCRACLTSAIAEQEKRDNTNIRAQEEVVSALWDFARSLGLTGTDADTTERIRAALPLTCIVRAYGFNVAEIQ